MNRANDTSATIATQYEDNEDRDAARTVRVTDERR